MGRKRLLMWLCYMTEQLYTSRQNQSIHHQNWIVIAQVLSCAMTISCDKSHDIYITDFTRQPGIAQMLSTMALYRGIFFLDHMIVKSKVFYIFRAGKLTRLSGNASVVCMEILKKHFTCIYVLRLGVSLVEICLSLLVEDKQKHIPQAPEDHCPGTGWVFLCGSCSWLLRL